MLATPKPEESGWRKGKFVLFWILATGGERGDSCPKADSFPLTTSGQVFIG